MQIIEQVHDKVFKETFGNVKIINIITESFTLLDEIMEKDTVTHYMESCLRYILSVRNDIEKEESW